VNKVGKRSYNVCSTHRRTVSQLLCREDDWSEEDGLLGGHGRGRGQARSLEVRGTYVSGIGHVFGDVEEPCVESLNQNGIRRGKQLKVLGKKGFKDPKRGGCILYYEGGGYH